MLQRFGHCCAFLSIGFFIPSICAAQQASNLPVSVIYRYADVADLALASSVVAHVKIRKSERLGGKMAQGVAPGRSRYLIKADVRALIRAPGTLAKRLTYLIDLPTDSRLDPNATTKGEVIVFAKPGRAGEIRLVAPDSQIVSSPELGLLVRSILAEAARPDAPPRVTGIGSVFHAPGNLTGEGESQIFLETEDGRPVSLNIRRRAGEPPHWFAAAGDTVDESALPPKRNSLLWYRLACSLPRALPAKVTAELDAEHGAALAADYQLVIQGLGTCQRARPPV
jgi:hypothetical protein